jgi:hypothetical protein
VLSLVAQQPYRPTTGVTIAPWDVLPNHGAESLRTVARTGDDVHVSVIAYARGEYVAHPALKRRCAGRCFAALRPDGWKALPGAEHQAWIEKRSDLDVPLAVRVREVRLDVRARLGTDVMVPDRVHAMRLHGVPIADIRSTLVPIALRARSLEVA